MKIHVKRWLILFVGLLMSLCSVIGSSSVQAEQAASLRAAWATPTPTVITGIVNRTANLRAGPGVEYAQVGRVTAKTQVNITGTNATRDWYQLESGVWIAAFLVDQVSGSAPVVSPLSTPPPVAPTQPATRIALGQRAVLDPWRMAVKQTDQATSVSVFPNDQFRANTGYTVFQVELLLENTANVTSTITLNPEKIIVLDDQGRVYPSIGAAIGEGRSFFLHITHTGGSATLRALSTDDKTLIKLEARALGAQAKIWTIQLPAQGSSRLIVAFAPPSQAQITELHWPDFPPFRLRPDAAPIAPTLTPRPIPTALPTDITPAPTPISVPTPLFRVIQNGKWGYINDSGKLVIAPQFANAFNFSEGLAVVRVDEHWGYINPLGEVVIKPQFVEASTFSEGLAAVKVDEKWGYIDQMGKLVIDPKFTNASEFSEGLAGVTIDDKAGFIDRAGKIVIEPQFSLSFSFADGLAAVKVGEVWGYLDKTGKFVIKPQFDSASSFSEGWAEVAVNGKYGYIDKTGKFIITPQFSVRIVLDMAALLDYGQVLYSDYRFSEGLAIVAVDEQWGYIDKAGKIVIEPHFDGAFPFSEGLAAVTVNEKMGYIDQTGEIIIEPQFDKAFPFTNGLATVIVDDKWGYVDKTGKFVWNPTR